MLPERSLTNSLYLFDKFSNAISNEQLTIRWGLTLWVALYTVISVSRRVPRSKGRNLIFNLHPSHSEVVSVRRVIHGEKFIV